MKIGVFVPIGNNGWLISTTAPQYMPTFELNKAIVQKAEHYHFDFALSMIKLRGFGGKTEFWDHNLESFTLMAGGGGNLAHQIYATAATLTLPRQSWRGWPPPSTPSPAGALALTWSPAGKSRSTSRWGSGRGTITSPVATTT